jgi:hypothetical protein
MFNYVVIGSAFLLAACAAWFSVTGISQLFIGAPIAAMAMASSLELAKLVSASFLYRHWTVISRPLRYYMGVGTFVLMVITSIGIYGYLSAAYASAAVDFNAKSSQIALIETQISGIDKNIERYESRLNQFISVRNQQEERLNNLVGKSGFVTQQRVVTQAETDIRNIQKEIDKLQKQRDSLSSIKVLQDGELQTNAKLGTFNYIAKTLGVSLDTVAKWFILAIVLVFDPMSLALVMSYNALVKLKTKSKEENIVSTVDQLVQQEDQTEVQNVLDQNINDENWISPEQIKQNNIKWVTNKDGSIGIDNS